MKIVLSVVIIATYVVLCFACSGNRQTATTGSLDKAGEIAGPGSKGSVPPCLLKMIDSAKGTSSEPGITEVRRYRYNGATVYLVGAPCCDQFNPLYDSACNYLFAPSGGFTGRGDGSHPEFFKVAKEDSLIWGEKNKTND